MHSQFGIPIGRMAWTWSKDGKVDGNTEEEKGKKRGNGRGKKTPLAMLWGSKESCSPNLEVLIVSFSWTWVPVNMFLLSTAMLIKQYCLTILHKPLQGVSVHLKGHCGVMLPACHSFCMSPPQDWFMIQQGTQTTPPLRGPCHWVKAPRGCASPASLYPYLESSILILCFSSGFFLYLINWLWSLVVCATRRKQTILEPVAYTSQVNFHHLPELKDHVSEDEQLEKWT